MSQSTIFILIAAAIAISFLIEWNRLKSYWSRIDYRSAKKWKNRFPDSSKSEIRDFLEHFVDGFAFSSKKRLKFEPDDKIQNIYTKLYPPNSFFSQADSLEYETFFMILEKEYKIDPNTFWKEDITLGEIFKIITSSKKVSTYPAH